MNSCPRLFARGIGGLATVIALALWTPTLLASTQRADDDPSTLSHNRGTDVWPSVQITCPEPTPLMIPHAPPSIRFEWEGTPGAKQGHHKIREYRFILLGPGSEFPLQLALLAPDSLRRYYANHPQGPWTGWSSTSPNATHAEFNNLVPNERYLFVVIAIDRAGGYTQVFSLYTNMLRFDVSFDAYQGPVLSMSGPGLNYQYPHGGYCPCAETEIPTSVSAGTPVTFHWSGIPGFACGFPAIRAYRWTLDIEDVFDQTPRTDEATDLSHWSAPSLTATSATVGPFRAGEVHRLYIEVEDMAGLKSLGIIRIEVAASANQRVAGVSETPGIVTLSPGAAIGNLAEVHYSLPAASDINLAAYDISGRRIALIESGSRAAGVHQAKWDRTGLRQGVYFYRLQAGPVTLRKTFVILR